MMYSLNIRGEGLLQPVAALRRFCPIYTRLGWLAVSPLDLPGAAGLIIRHYRVHALLKIMVVEASNPCCGVGRLLGGPQRGAQPSFIRWEPRRQPPAIGIRSVWFDTFETVVGQMRVVRTWIDA